MHVFNHLSRIALLAVLGLAVVVSSADAQGRMGRGRQSGMQGRRPGGPQVSGTVPGVQLSAEQRQRVAAIRRETQQQVQSIRRDPNLSARQRTQRIAEAQQRGHQRVLDVLTPAQRQQFAEAYQQRSRVAGYRGRPGMVPAAGGVSGTVPGVRLSQAQRERVAAIRRETMQEVQSIRRDQGLTPQQRQERIAEIRRRGHDRVLEVLTPEQREQFRQWWDERHGVAAHLPGRARGLRDEATAVQQTAIQGFHV